jgi:Zn-dependent M16 (insulinase) family peptidase
MKLRKLIQSLLVALMVTAALPPPTYAQQTVSLATLTEGQTVSGFRATALYLNDSDEPFGARFVHQQTGFVLDFLEIQSVPQTFIWVNSFPTSDRGEPHTQEHLLLGKGNVGRAHSSLESLSLVGSSAFTDQLRTCYHFHTAAGSDMFYKLFESQMNSLLHPDYTDEEIRREVSHWGVSDNPTGRGLRLEEKGTVYQEMVTTFERPDALLSRALNRMIFGADHPLAWSAGGWPDAIRTMKPDDIRKFHREHYHLGNMGAVSSFPKEMPVTDVLRTLDGILSRIESTQEARRYPTESELANAKPAPAGQIQVVEYPDKNEQQPVQLIFAWPARLKLTSDEKTFLGTFLESFADDPTTNLYKMFVDSKTRVMDTGAQSVFGYFDTQTAAGNPIYIGLTDVAPDKMTTANITTIRAKIMAEAKRIGSLADGSAELRDFNARVGSRITASRRDLSKFVNSPPGFGFRETYSSWMNHLIDLNRTPGFRKSVTLKPELQAVDERLRGDRNIWRDMIAKWRLADTVPYAVVAKPSARLIAATETARQQRARDEALRLQRQYHAPNQQSALRRYKADYDVTTTRLEELAAKPSAMRFIDNPPLTLDDQLNYKVTKVAGDVPMVASYFENMTSATTGMAFRLDGVADDQLLYLSGLPALMIEAGVIKDGKPISFEEFSEMVRKEILGLSADYQTNFETGKAELVVSGSGNNLAESKRALELLKLVLNSPDWRPENLPRIRDLIDQMLAGLRSQMQGAEETWVNDPARAYRRQDSLLLLATDSFLTQSHNIQRLRWLLKDAGTGQSREAIDTFLGKLAGAGAKGNRTELQALLSALQAKNDARVSPALKPFGQDFSQLSAEPKVLATEAAKDLDQLLTDIPDETLAKDWDYLCRQMRHDLSQPPADTLAKLNALRRSILKTGGARMFVIGTNSTIDKLQPSINDLVSTVENGPLVPVKRSSVRLVDERVRERLGEKVTPLFVGLVNANTQGGVIIDSAPMVTYDDSDNREKLLDFLASNLYAGGGAHSMFMKTWGAGLAYSNGFGGSPAGGRLSYYAERTPELPQTVRFVVDELKKAKPDRELVEYAIAISFLEFRSASAYEQRGAAIAADLADDVPPEKVRRFRQALLELRRSPALAAELFGRMKNVYGRVLPGLGTKARDVKNGLYYVIGPEKQLAAYEQYLKTVEGPETRLFRIYPRDYWMTFKN